MFEVYNNKEHQTRLQRFAGLFVQLPESDTNLPPTNLDRLVAWFDQRPIFLAVLLGILTPTTVMCMAVFSRRVLPSESELIKILTLAIAFPCWQPLNNRTHRGYLWLALLICVAWAVCLTKLGVFGLQK